MRFFTDEVAVRVLDNVERSGHHCSELLRDVVRVALAKQGHHLKRTLVQLADQRPPDLSLFMRDYVRFILKVYGDA